MATDEEKYKLAKLLNGLEVAEVKLPERCNDLVKQFREQYQDNIDGEEMSTEIYTNPYIPDEELLKENEQKLQELLAESKRDKKSASAGINLSVIDPKRPWRTHSNKEKLLRIDNELKQHKDQAALVIKPLEEDKMNDLIKECREETNIAPPVGADRLRETVDEAMRNLPNFMYKIIPNSTAIAILPEAAIDKSATPATIDESLVSGSGQYIPRPDSRQCFLRSLAELKNLRILALEYAHLADGTGYALLSILPVLRRPHFRLQFICREDQTPGRANPELGTGGYEIPDTAWKRVAIACPDLYLFMAFFRIRDYNHIRRFLTPSMPLREVHWQHGLDLNFEREHSDMNCFMRLLAYRYAATLVSLSIHQWRRAEWPLHRVLELLPLNRLVYTGRVCFKDLRDTLNLVACGVCTKLKGVYIQIQDDEAKRDYWAKTTHDLKEEFKDIMDLYDIRLNLNVYKI